MSEPVETAAEVTTIAPEQQKPEMVVPIDEQTAFAIKLQEFDRDIANAEQKVAEVKAQKANWVYTSNIEKLARNHQENILRQQAEEAVKKQLATAKADANS
jgi:hypothetical protein